MNKFIKMKWLVALPLLVGMFMTSVLVARPAHAADEKTLACSKTFLGFPTWHKYLVKTTDEVKDPITNEPVIDPRTGSPKLTCDIVVPGDNFLKGNTPWLIGAAVIEMLLRFVALGAVIMVISGGFKIMTSNGSPDAVTTGRNSIFNALIGLAIAVVATTLVSYLINTLVGTAVINDVTGLPEVSAEEATALKIILNIVYRIAAGVTVLLITIAGFNFMTAGGDPQKVAKARQGIINSLIGLAITLSAVAIVAMIGGKL